MARQQRHPWSTPLPARPGGEGNAFHLLLIDKADLPDGTWRCLPKEPTHGISGVDISGIAFVNAPVGPPGTGLAAVLKGLQLTRAA